MKSVLCCIILFSLMPILQPGKNVSASEGGIQLRQSSTGLAPNLVIVTIDGLRWQEIFRGADPLLINNLQYTPDTATIKMQYWANDKEERRQKLMPFFWNVMAMKASLN